MCPWSGVELTFTVIHVSETVRVVERKGCVGVDGPTYAHSYGHRGGRDVVVTVITFMCVPPTIGAWVVTGLGRRRRRR